MVIPLPPPKEFEPWSQHDHALSMALLEGGGVTSIMPHFHSDHYTHSTHRPISSTRQLFDTTVSVGFVQLLGSLWEAQSLPASEHIHHVYSIHHH